MSSSSFLIFQNSANSFSFTFSFYFSFSFFWICYYLLSSMASFCCLAFLSFSSKFLLAFSSASATYLHRISSSLLFRDLNTSACLSIIFCLSTSFSLNLAFSLSFLNYSNYSFFLAYSSIFFYSASSFLLSSALYVFKSSLAYTNNCLWLAYCLFLSISLSLSFSWSSMTYLFIIWPSSLSSFNFLICPSLNSYNYCLMTLALASFFWYCCWSFLAVFSSYSSSCMCSRSTHYYSIWESIWAFLFFKSYCMSLSCNTSARNILEWKALTWSWPSCMFLFARSNASCLAFYFNLSSISSIFLLSIYIHKKVNK